MSTSYSLVFLYELLNCFSQDLKIQPERLSNLFLNPTESYSALINLICEYIFLIERLQYPANIYIQKHHRRIRNCNNCIKLLFVELFLFKYYFPISILNDQILSNGNGLVIVLGWVLEKSNILTTLSKYVLQHRTGELFSQSDNMFDTITLYPSMKDTQSINQRNNSLPICELLIPMKSEYSRITSILRELRITVELSVCCEQQVRNANKTSVDNWERLVSLIKDYGLVDLHYLQSKYLTEHFMIYTKKQTYAINSLKSAFSNIHQFWFLFNPATKNYFESITEDTGRPLQQPMSVTHSFQSNHVCFIKQVISSGIVVVYLNSDDKCNHEKEQLKLFKFECQRKLNSYSQCLSSLCAQFNSKANGLLVLYNFTL